MVIRRSFKLPSIKKKFSFVCEICKTKVKILWPLSDRFICFDCIPHAKIIKEFNSLSMDFKDRIRYLTRKHFTHDPKCSLCNSVDNLEFHHLNYKIPIDKKDFISVCKDCHVSEHKKLNKNNEVSNVSA